MSMSRVWWSCRRDLMTTRLYRSAGAYALHFGVIVQFLASAQKRLTEPKLSDCAGRRGSCAAGSAGGTGAVTPGAVRCSAWLAREQGGAFAGSRRAGARNAFISNDVSTSSSGGVSGRFILGEGGIK